MTSAMQSPGSRQRWVSFDEARMILRMSEGTLRRAIKDGKVTAEQRRRNPDSDTDLRMVYEVLVTDPPAAAAPIESAQPPAPATEPPEAIAALVDALAEERAERQRLSVENAHLRERAVRAETALDAARETAADLARRLEAAEAERDRLRARRWWRFWE